MASWITLEPLSNSTLRQFEQLFRDLALCSLIELIELQRKATITAFHSQRDAAANLDRLFPRSSTSAFANCIAICDQLACHDAGG